MKYLKVFTDFAQDIKELNDAERGRLFTAMLAYAETGEEQKLGGNERYIWGTAKKNIDAQRTKYDGVCETNRQNVKKRWENGIRNDTTVYDRIRNDTTVYDRIQDKDKEQDTKEKPPKGGKKKGSAEPFTPPTVDEVAEYCRERRNGIDAAYFVDYYTAQKWYRAKGVKMSDWKAAVRTWEKNGVQRGAKYNKAAHGYAQSPIRGEDVERMTVHFANDKYGSENYPQRVVRMEDLQDAIIDFGGQNETD